MENNFYDWVVYRPEYNYSFAYYQDRIIEVIKIDGNMAVAWSDTLSFTVERSGKTLLGSAASGEGLVNVYRGTGKILMAPVL